MSPSSNQGTETASDFPKAFEFVFNNILMPIIMPLMGMSHSLDKGTKRIIYGISDDSLKSEFLCHKEKVFNRTYIDQSTIFLDLK